MPNRPNWQSLTDRKRKVDLWLPNHNEKPGTDGSGVGAIHPARILRDRIFGGGGPKKGRSEDCDEDPRLAILIGTGTEVVVDSDTEIPIRPKSKIEPTREWAVPVRILGIPNPAQFDVEQIAEKLKPLSRAGGAKSQPLSGTKGTL